jgi:tetratricopeptide (TPR) repeat protein
MLPDDLTMIAIISLLIIFLVVTAVTALYIMARDSAKKRRNALDRLCDNVRLNTDPSAKMFFRRALGLLIGQEYIKVMTFRKAAEKFINIAKTTPDTVDKAYCFGWAGRCYEDSGDLAVAATCYAAATAVAPSDTYALERLGDFFWEADELEAVRLYEQLLKYDPLSPRAHYKLGRIYSKRLEPESAIGHYQSAINVHNGYVAPMAEAAIEYAKIGDKDNVRKFYNLALANDVQEFEKLFENVEKALSGEVA